MQILEVEINQEYIALNDLLKITGIADSGGQGKQMVADGLVYVDGVLELRKTCKIRSGQIVVFNEQIRILVVAENQQQPE